MLFIFSTPVSIRHLRQLKTVVFLHWFLICALLLNFLNFGSNKHIVDVASAKVAKASHALVTIASIFDADFANVNDPSVSENLLVCRMKL